MASKKPWEMWLQELKEFVGANSRLPVSDRGSSTSDHERSISYWLARQREGYKGNSMPKERQELLSEVPGMQERFQKWDGTEDAARYPDPGELAADSGLSAEVLAVLPPDAPQGHESYRKIVYREGQGIAVFQYAGSEGKINFQTTVAACGSVYAALRIARACYLRFDNNETKPEILEFRAACYSRLQEVNGTGGKPVKQKNTATAGATDAKVSKKRKATTDTTPKIQEASGDLMASPSPQASASEAQCEVTGQQSPPSADQVLGDAPQGHVAWEKVTFDEAANMCLIRHQENGVKLKLDISPKQVGDMETAMRIGRLCFAEFHEGRKNPKEVLKYRNELCKLVKHAKPVRQDEDRDKKTKRARKDKKTSALQATPEHGGAGRLIGAIRFDGRAAGKKNSSMLGTYTVVPGGFGGYLAYQRWSEDGQPPHFMFYAPEKKRWKVSNTLGDTKGGFAYVKTPDGTKPPSDLPHGATWLVFEGKEKGYVEDAFLTCVPLHPAVPAEKAAEPTSVATAAPGDGHADESAGTAAAAEPMEGVAGQKASTRSGLDAAEIVEDGSDDASSSESSSSASEDDQGSEDGSASEAGKDAAEIEEPKRAASVTPTSKVASPPAESDISKVSGTPDHPVIRPCAKMLVRIGLRCACHFTYVRNCPGGTGQLNRLNSQ
eukprot:TRINITY_DN89596_c0_g1_i1.p1 TRINITY_DN89596_c0_g1~~TRINITY_DN89596_c0_g1_i1.p1  ORF type:complete len:665 (-),score=122.28 TRINITY_DN89596_c0_g1_i1:177-2171(-)